MRNMWFKELMGFLENDINPDQVRSSMQLSSTTAGILTSAHSNRRFQCGTLTIPSLGELRHQVDTIPENKRLPGRIQLSQIVANVQQLHLDPVNAGATFQVASQFNLLEMASPDAVPEDGVGIYGSDQTQGPACAVACGAGTIYRNYYVPILLEAAATVGGGGGGGGDGQQIGQTAARQIDCLQDLGRALGNDDTNKLWTMKNGYALATLEGLESIERRLAIATSTAQERDALLQLVRIGIQSDTQVTLHDCRHTVTQVYCSALPVRYGDHAAYKWQAFARLILEACYEATFHAAVLNAAKTGNRRVYLTLVGGGVFGNEIVWILEAMERTLRLFRNVALDVRIVSHKRSNPSVQELVDKYSQEQ